MNNTSSSKKLVSSESKYDPSLDAYTDEVFFPQKVEEATELYKRLVLPYQKQKGKKPFLTALQNELLNIYTFEPTEEEMLQLKAFLAQLFADKIKESKVKKEAMNA
jgi:hypothetical protein